MPAGLPAQRGKNAHAARGAPGRTKRLMPALAAQPGTPEGEGSSANLMDGLAQPSPADVSGPRTHQPFSFPGSGPKGPIKHLWAGILRRKESICSEQAARRPTNPTTLRDAEGDGSPALPAPRPGSPHGRRPCLSVGFSRSGGPRAHGHMTDRAWREDPLPSAYVRSGGYHSLREHAVCKTVGSAYVGSNPTPATTCEDGP